jgi:Flp pilus assembly protein TadD
LAALAVGMPVAAQADAGAYVRARAAAAAGAVDAAAAGYGAVLAAAPDDAVVAIRAYRNALASGDLLLARRAAAVLKRADVAPMDVAILDLADALRSGNRVAADDALGRLGAGPLDFVAPVVRAWLAQARGGDPFAILDNAREGGLGRRYFAEHRALLLIASGRSEEGVAALRTATGIDTGDGELRTTAAMLLAAKGERKAARELLGEDAGKLRKIKPDAAFGAGRLFTRLAGDLSTQQAESLVIALTRAALTLDPGNDGARLLLAEALKSDGAFGSALAALAAIRPGSDAYPAAQAERIKLIQARGERGTALDVAAALAGRTGAAPSDRQLYADMLVEAGRDAEAARIYADLLAQTGEAASWADHLQLGGALERSGQWAQALPHLRRAVELGPDQPIALNYLGYAMVDRGENIAQARQLLERASQLRPDDPSITDSLGWAYFRAGEYARALPLLERAAQGNPASPTINEHLGDAYWTAGRRFEARYAWRAAAIYAEGEQQARIAGKLADGLRGDAPSLRKENVGRWTGGRETRRWAARAGGDDQRMAAN